MGNELATTTASMLDPIPNQNLSPPSPVGACWELQPGQISPRCFSFSSTTVRFALLHAARVTLDSLIFFLWCASGFPQKTASTRIRRLDSSRVTVVRWVVGGAARFVVMYGNDKVFA